MQRLPAGMPVTVIRNKADISGDNVTLQQVDTPHGPFSVISLSANTGQGVELLRDHLSQSMGLDTTTEGQFIARRRHIDAIDNTLEHLQIGEQQLHDNLAGELLAEELRLAHQHLSEITGEFSSDDLLGRIFSSFCIGK